MCVDACTFGALTYEEREEEVKAEEEVERGDMEMAYEQLVKKHGRSGSWNPLPACPGSKPERPGKDGETWKKKRSKNKLLTAPQTVPMET